MRFFSGSFCLCRFDAFWAKKIGILMVDIFIVFFYFFCLIFLRNPQILECQTLPLEIFLILCVWFFADKIKLSGLM
jgi:hypothetical protein